MAWTRPAPLPLHARILAALPDMATCGFFLMVWSSPFVFGPASVKTAMLVMLVEFILVHASGFLGATVLATNVARATRIKALLGFAVFYLLFIGAFVLAFGQWWPLLAFGWLLLAKFAGVLARRGPGPGESARMASGWALGVMAYLGGVFLTLFAPVPEWGMTRAARADFGLEGGGVWVDEPHRVVAFGAVYFAFLAMAKLRDWVLPGTQLDLPERRD